MKTFLLLFIFSLQSYSNSNIYFSTDYRPKIGRILIYLKKGNQVSVVEDHNHCFWNDFGSNLACIDMGFIKTTSTSLEFLDQNWDSKLFKFTNISHLRLTISRKSARILIMDPPSSNIADVLPLKANFPTASIELLYNRLEN